MAKLTLELVNEQADGSELDEATRTLQDDLDALDGCTVGQPSRPAPPGTKGLDAALTGQLLLATVGSGGIAVTLLSVLRDWLMRHKEYKLRIKRGEVEIELCGSDPEALMRLLADAKALLLLEEHTGA
jgi:hypothetical protein